MSLVQNHRLFRSASCFAVMLVAILLAGIVGAAQPEAGGKQRQPSLDEQLLEELGKDLPAAKPRAKTDDDDSKVDGPRDQHAGKQAVKPSKGRDLIDELLEDLGGEDVSLSANPANENPLVRLHSRMREVKRQIADERSGEATQRLQHEISDDLGKLIAELERACQQSKSASSSSQRQQANQPKPATKPGDQASGKPARDSSARTKEQETAKVDPARLNEMLKDVWGHLPPHLRQQMEQSANEEFLPQYELEIAEYFRSLIGSRKERK